MICDVNFKFKCSSCDKKFDERDVYGYCQKCDCDRFHLDYIKEMVGNLALERHFIEEKEQITGLENDHEKDIFIRGCKLGYKDALFWMCDYVQIIDFFEEHIIDKFYLKNKEIT